MKSFLFKSALWITAGLVMATSCKKDDDEDDNQDDPPVENISHYLLTGSYGDLITYTIDEINLTYSYVNETTGATGSGTYFMSADPNLSGVYEISSGGETFYTILLADKFMVTSVPSGRPENKLCFGVSSDLDLTTYNTSDLSGKYLYVWYNDFNDSTDWGGYELLQNGTYTYNFGTNYPEDWNDAVQFSGAGGGNWSISGTNNSRITFSEGGTDYVGTVLPGKLMLMDDGVGNGFTLGLKYPDLHSSQEQVSGTYRFLDITTSGETGVGYYTIPAMGTAVNYYYRYTGGTQGSGIAGFFGAVPEVKSMFKASETIDDITYTTYFVILPGEIMMHYCIDSANVISYGIGARIN
jgi:hypothetical protein